MNTNVPVPPSNGGGLPGDRVIRGTVARWSATTGWVDRDGLPLPNTMLVIGYTTVLRRWKDKKPEYITEQPLRDPKALNDKIPVEEWEIGLDDNPTPPWKFTYVIYFVDLKTGALFTYAHDTYGAMLCFNNLEDAISMMRLLRGEHVLPIVHLEKRPWKSPKYGMQIRPHLQPTGDWRSLGGGFQSVPPSPTPQLSGPPTPTPPASTPTTPTTPSSTSTPLPPPAATPAAPASTILDNTKPIKPVTVAELVADEIPWK